MTRDSGRRDVMREQLAYLAARIMAEDGIGDFALAKRKAARQAGVPDTRHLPTNEEVEQAFKSYQSLYHQDEHRLRLRFLRAAALRAMREFSCFNPYLVGSVLSGNVGRYSDINLYLFTDNVKEVELYLIDRKVTYRQAEMRLYAGDRLRTLPHFVLIGDETGVTLTVFPSDDVRCMIKGTLEGRVIERARVDAVCTLAEGEEGVSSAGDNTVQL